LLDGTAARAVEAAPSEPGPALRPKTLRSKGVPKRLSESRAHGRSIGAVALDNACRKHGVSSAELAADLGVKRTSDKEGDEARSGALLVSAGELFLCPSRVGVPLDTFLELLLHRLASEPAGSDDANREIRVAFHLLALRDILNEPPPFAKFIEAFYGRAVF
jgi:hypothetical protein